MTETRITAQLPKLDVEFTRQELPEQNAETITMRLTATPSFEAFGNHLFAHSGLPFGPAAALQAAAPMMTPGLGAAWLAPWAAMPVNPMMAWAQMAQAVWAPWLAHHALAPPQSDPDQTG
ncbi:MAG: hypothetical protein AAFR17_02520 [Pseudomonadota bacterium]